MAKLDPSDDTVLKPPTRSALDDIDYGILFALQQDARSTSTAAIGDMVGVSASTVRNRIKRLEELGVIEGYTSKINYERAGFQLNTQFVCTVPTDHRNEIAKSIFEISGVVDIREMLAAERNLYVEVVATDTTHLATITNEISNHDAVVVGPELITNHFRKPFSVFEY